MVFLRKNEDLSVDPKVVEKMQREIYKLRTLLKEMSENTSSLPRISDLHTSPLALPGNAPDHELEKLRQENASLRATLDKRLPSISSPSTESCMEELELSKLTSFSVFDSLESVIKVANRFFAFEIEEDDLKGAIDKAASPGLASMAKFKAFLTASTNTASITPKKGRSLSARNDRISPMRTRMSSQVTQIATGSPSGAEKLNISASHKESVIKVENSTKSSLDSKTDQVGSRSTSRFRVRGKAGDVNTVDESCDQEALLAAQLSKAKARMAKHQKLQAWLKAKEEKELALLEMEEVEEKEHQNREAKREKRRKHQARKSKDKLKSFYQSLEKPGLGANQGDSNSLPGESDEEDDNSCFGGSSQRAPDGLY